VIRNGRKKTFRFDLRIYSGLELREQMQRVGFSDICITATSMARRTIPRPNG
jgi:hypothetical protein